MWCVTEVPGMILLHHLKGAMQLDCSKDMSACFNLHKLRFQCISASYVEVVVLVRHVSMSHHKNE
jgi:hypothetical protein